MRCLPLAFALVLPLGCSDQATPAGATPGGGGGAGNAGGAAASVAGVAGIASLPGGSGGAGAPVAAGNSGGSALGGGGASSQAGAAGSLAGGVGAAGSGGSEPNPPGVPADYQLFIDQSFASADSLSELRFADPADWVHQDAAGGYVESTAATYAPPHASLHALAIFGALKLGAFVLEAEVMQTNPSGGHRDFCVAWGIESPSRYYYAHIAQAHDAVAHNIHIVLDADRTAITDQYVDGFDWGTDVWHKLRVTRSAVGDMAVYADGVAMPLLTASDTRLGEGYVGFGSFDDKGRVRNVKVWAPSASQQPADFFMTK